MKNHTGAAALGGRPVEQGPLYRIVKIFEQLGARFDNQLRRDYFPAVALSSVFSSVQFSSVQSLSAQFSLDPGANHIPLADGKSSLDLLRSVQFSSETALVFSFSSVERCPQCLPSDTVPIRSRAWTLRPPAILHRRLPYFHTIPVPRRRR